jgi:hypothetical protein
VESEAKIIRLIYSLFLQGKTVNAIAKYLTIEGIPTPAKKEKWLVSTVLSILQNEKYKGEALLQKEYTVDFLTKKKKINEGEVPQYYVKNSHPAIIEPEMHDLVQAEILKRKTTGLCQSGITALSSRVVCGECGSFFGSKLLHSTSKYRRTVWRCNNKYKSKGTCTMPHLYETTIHKAFVVAFNRLYGNKERLIEDYKTIIEALTDTTALDREATAQHSECEVVTELMRKCVEENASTALNQDEYHQRYTGLVTRYEAAKAKFEKITEEKQARDAKRKRISKFISDLEQCGGLLTEFDEGLWCETIETITIYSESEVVVAFRDSSEIRVDIPEK